MEIEKVKSMELSVKLSFLPMEILIMISSSLPPSSRALFALMCKRLYFGLTTISLIPRARVLSDTGWCGLKISKELPSNFTTWAMSEPRRFQPERWELLRLLEKDISDRWLLCYDCFILHPTQAFRTTQHPLVYRLDRNLRKLLGLPTLPRTCHPLPQGTLNPKITSRSLSGIVDLCPCIHLTPARRDLFRSWFKILLSYETEAKQIIYNHQCRHFYDDDVELAMRINPFLYKGDGSLGIRSLYILTVPNDTENRCSRMTCPHISLTSLIENVTDCRGWHADNVVCAHCKPFYCCPKCQSTVSHFSEEYDFRSKNLTYKFEVERRLDDEFWGKNVCFPFARQREYERLHVLHSCKFWKGFWGPYFQHWMP